MRKCPIVILAFALGLGFACGQDLPHAEDEPPRASPGRIPPPRFGHITGAKAQRMQDNLTRLDLLHSRISTRSDRTFLVEFQLADELKLTDRQVEKINDLERVRSTEVQQDVLESDFTDHPDLDPRFLKGGALLLNKSDFEKFLTLFERRYLEKKNESDKQIGRILNAKQNRRLKQIKFQYYTIESPRVSHALSLYEQRIPQEESVQLEARLGSNIAKTTYDSGYAIQAAKLRAVRDGIDRKDSNRVFGEPFHFGYLRDWLDVSMETTEESTTEKQINPRRRGKPKR